MNQASISPDKVKIAGCSCKHKYQDTRFGKGRRAFNKCTEKVGYRCTVCGAVKA